MGEMVEMGQATRSLPPYGMALAHLDEMRVCSS